METIAHTDWQNDVKREAAVEMVRARSRQLGQDAKESAIRGMVEFVVVGLKEAEVVISDLGTVEASDIEGAELV